MACHDHHELRWRSRDPDRRQETEHLLQVLADAAHPAESLRQLRVGKLEPDDRADA
jgi:hypothetical protein